jgi:hypothetical protein
MRRTRIGMGQRREDAAGTEPSPTRISAQSFSAGAKAWEGRVGKDRSSPNSFGSNFTSMRDMWAGRFLNTSESLGDRWGKDGRINNSAEQQASFDRRTGVKPATTAAAPAAVAATPAAGPATLKPDDYMGAPGTKKPVGDTYGTVAAEAASKGAGNPAFMAAGGTSNAALTRTKQVPFIYSTVPGATSIMPGVTSRFYEDKAPAVESPAEDLFGDPVYDLFQTPEEPAPRKWRM